MFSLLKPIRLIRNKGKQKIINKDILKVKLKEKKFNNKKIIKYQIIFIKAVE